MDKLDILRHKIIDADQLQKLVALWRFQDKKIVFTNGCFDLMHAGHIDYLAKAASLGDVMIVGLNSDQSVSSNKGPSRPVNDEYSRSHIMASLFFVTAVVLFDDQTPAKLIELVKPDVLVKGGDYKKEDVVGYDTVTKSGGEVVIIDLVEGYSTTALENKILRAGR